jgi:hypothetical protein
MEEGNDQPRGGDHIYTLRSEEAFLQTDDQKPAIIAKPPPDPAQFKCWFCRKSHEHVQTLFGAEYPVRDPHNFANETLIFICNECVTRFAESLAQDRPRLHGHRRSPAEIGLAVPGRPIGP